MDSKERVPDYGESILSSQKMKCTLKQLEDALKELSDEVKKEGIAEIDFYYNESSLEKEFKKVINEYLWNNTIL